MAYNRHSPPRGGPRDDRGRSGYEEPYRLHDRSYRPAPTEGRSRDYYSSERERDWHHSRSRSRSWSPPPAHGSDSRSGGAGSHNDFADHRGATLNPSDSYGYRDWDAPRRRSRSRDGSPGGAGSEARFVSRDVIVEGFGGELTDDDVGTPAVAP